MSRIRRVAGATLRRVRGARPGPLVSVVVAVRGRADCLGDCLDSILASTHQALEVLVAAEPGNARAIAAVASARQARARRVRVVGGPEGARLDAAVAQARGDYLAFADAGDVVPPDAYARLVSLLEETGSDLALGAQRLARAGGARFPAPQPALFVDRAVRLTLEQHPEALVDLTLTNKLFRRSTWTGADLSLSGWVGSASTVAQAYLAAETFDVWPGEVYEQHPRDTALPVDEQERFRVDLAAERAEALGRVDRLVRAGGEGLHRTWLVSALTHLLPPLFVDAVGGGSDFHAAVAPLARQLLEQADDATLSAVPVHQRTMAWVATRGSLEDLARVEDLLADHPHGLPTERAASGAQVVRLPRGIRVSVPELVSRVEAVDRRLRTTVDPVLHVEGGRAVVTGAAFVEYAEHGTLPTVTIGTDATATAMQVESRRDPALNLWAERAFEDRSGCGFTARLDESLLPPSPSGRWEVEVHVGRRSRTHAVQLPDKTDELGPRLLRAVLGDGELLLHGTSGSPSSMRLTSGKGATGWAPVRSEGGERWSVALSLRTEQFGTPSLLPGGGWVVEARTADEGRLHGLRWAEALLDHPPDLVAERLRLVPTAGGEAGPVVRVAAPQSSDERSFFDQQRLLTSVYAAPATPSYDSTVLLETFRGRSVGDNPGAIGQELLARGLDLDLAWVVDDPSVTVPEGTRAVPRRTKAWYDALANAHAYVANAGAPYWFAKKPGQVHLQTWHGTPLKRIGEDRGPGDFQTWRHRRRIAAQAAGWDAMLSPSPFCSEIFPRAFRFDGDLLEVGYPRNDVLVHGSPQIRRRVRDRVGARDGDRVVLYAPTWREYVGVRDSKPLYLDAERLTRLLPDSVVLVRGHYNSTTQADVFAAHPRIHDVTRYPDIADLYLAADALVTDYSSVMFDYVLTDRPTVLLAPDLEQYRDVERGFYFDVERERPGPLVTTTEEVAACLDAPDEFAAARQSFRERFCPWDDGRASARVADWLLARL